MECALVRSLNAEVSLALGRPNFFLNPSVEVRVELGHRSAVDHCELQGSGKARQEPAGLIFRNDRLTSVAQKPSGGFLSQTGLLPANPEHIRIIAACSHMYIVVLSGYEIAMDTNSGKNFGGERTLRSG
jgi:hypothetical protein